MLKANENVKNGNKIERYGWTTKDDRGELAWVDKNALSVDDSYQRPSSNAKILNLASEWSWVGCGVIVVSRRDGKMFVVDGQHRVMAALKRSDITHLPAIIFNHSNVTEEAEGFINLNVNRNSLKTIQKFKALVKAKNPAAIAVSELLNKYNITLSKNIAPYSTNSAARLMKTIEKQPEKTYRVFGMACELCNGDYVSETIIAGLWILDTKIKDGLNCPRLRKRLFDIGKDRLYTGAKRAAAFFSKGGENIWADGMLQELNRNLKNKFEFEA